MDQLELVKGNLDGKFSSIQVVKWYEMAVMLNKDGPRGGNNRHNNNR